MTPMLRDDIGRLVRRLRDIEHGKLTHEECVKAGQEAAKHLTALVLDSEWLKELEASDVSRLGEGFTNEGLAFTLIACVRYAPPAFTAALHVAADRLRRLPNEETHESRRA